MGLCFSATKISGASSNNRRTPPPKNQTTTKAQNNNREDVGGGGRRRRQSGGGMVACGKRTDFGYLKNFDERYKIGKLLGHGQFGYTYVGIDRGNGDRVAVKRIDKSKVHIKPVMMDVKDVGFSEFLYAALLGFDSYVSILQLFSIWGI